MSRLAWVDDDINNPELSLERGLLEERHEVNCFSGITKFLDHFKDKYHTEKYDGIILELMLYPENVFSMEESKYGSRTGILLIDKIKKIPNFKDSEIIIYSSIDDPHLISEESNIHFFDKSEFPDEFVKKVEMILDPNMQHETDYEPFDVVIYKPTRERGLVKRVTENGVFVLFRIQSTAQLCKFEDIEKE